MNFDRFFDIYKSHHGAINGAVAGLIIAVAILIFGFFKVLFVLICTGIGYYLGGKISRDEDFLKKLLERFLPHGKYR